MKTKIYDIAIFDMDGTILNTLDDLADSMNYVLKQYNMPVRTIDEVRNFVGNGIRKLIERAAKEGTSEEQIDEMFNTFNEYYKTHCAVKTKAYDGIKELIVKLKAAGIKTAVISNKADYGVQALCEQYFDGLFDYAVGEKKGVRRKPCADSVYHVLEYFDIRQNRAVYIGDSDVDYKTSVNAGVDSIMVTWGFRDEEFLRAIGATRFVNRPEEIYDIIIV